MAGRTVQILRLLETALTATPEGLSARFGVGPRSIANDVAALNDVLLPAASIRLTNGLYRLYVLDPTEYRARRATVLHAGPSLNEPHRRMALAFERLLDSTRPVRLDDLASLTCVSRATAASDVAALRDLLAPHGVTVEGRPHSGLTLRGDELSLRLAGISHFASTLCDPDALPSPILDSIRTLTQRYDLTRDTEKSLARWASMLLRRHMEGHPLTSPPPTADELAGSPANTVAGELMTTVSRVTGRSFPEAERLFLATAIATMRTPLTPQARSVLAPSHDTATLVTAILDRIREDMGIRLDTADLSEEFMHHLSFMINRMRFQVRLDENQVTDIRSIFPVATEMATIAQGAIREQTGLDITTAEATLLASYFQVFLEAHREHHGPALTIAITTCGGAVAARLTRIQLEKFLPSDTRYIICRHDEVAAAIENDCDLVITDPGCCENIAEQVRGTPVIELGAVFDGHELESKLQRLKLSGESEVGLVGAATPLIASLLDPDKFLPLPPATTYPEATVHLVRNLRDIGTPAPDLTAALQRREARSTMRLDRNVAFPHLTVEGLARVTLAMAVIPHLSPEDTSGDGTRVVFLMLLPDKANYDDSLLIEVYDEIIRLASYPALLDPLSRLTTHEDLFWFLATHPSLLPTPRKVE